MDKTTLRIKTVFCKLTKNIDCYYLSITELDFKFSKHFAIVFIYNERNPMLLLANQLYIFFARVSDLKVNLKYR